MAIVGQNSILNQFTFPMAIGAELKDGQVLVYDAQTKKFTNKEASTLNLTNNGGLTSVEVQTFISDGVQTIFNIPWKASGKKELLITLDGLKLNVDEYSISYFNDTTNITFNTAIPVGVEIEVVGLRVTDISNIKYYANVGNGVGFSYVLPWRTTIPQSLIVFLDGVRQHTSAFVISPNTATTTLIFDEVIPLGMVIEVIGVTGIIDSSVVQLEDILGNNLGVGGEGLYAYTTSNGTTQTINLKSLVAGAGITLTSSHNFITIETDAALLENVGTGEEILVDDTNFKTLVAGNNIVLNSTADEITISSTADAQTLGSLPATDYATTLQSVGLGTSLVAKGSASSDSTFSIKALREGQDILITEINDEIVISSLAGGAYVTVIEDVKLDWQTTVAGVRDTSIPLTIELPQADYSGPGKQIIIKDETGGASLNNITIIPDQTDGSTIQGQGSYVIDDDYGAVSLYSNGIDWHLLPISVGGGSSTVIDNLNDLIDVTIATPNSGQILSYNGSQWINSAQTVIGLADTDNSIVNNGFLKWKNDGSSVEYVTSINYDVLTNAPNIPQNLNDLNDVNTTGAINGHVLKYNGSSWVPSIDLSGGGGGGGGAATIVELTDVDDIPVGNAFLQWDVLGSNVQFTQLSQVAISGDYNDLNNLPGPAPIMLDDLADVNAPNPSIGYVLKFDGSEWTPSLESSSTITKFIDLSDTNEPSMPNGYIKWDSAGNFLEYTTTIPASSIIGLPPVAISGNYYDLINIPAGGLNTIVSLDDVDSLPIQDGFLRWDQTGTQVIYQNSISTNDISDLAVVATTNSYNDLDDLPSILTLADPLVANRVLISNSDGEIDTSPFFTYTDAGGLEVAGMNIFENTITALSPNSDIVIIPNGDGDVIVGQAGDGEIIAQDHGHLLVSGGNSVDLVETAGDLILKGGDSTSTVAGNVYISPGNDSTNSAKLVLRDASLNDVIVINSMPVSYENHLVITAGTDIQNVEISSDYIEAASNAGITFTVKGAGALEVSNVGYESNVTQHNDIPNKKYTDYDKVAVVTSTSYLLLESDAGKTIYFTNSSPITVTLPETATSAMDIGWNVTLVQEGTGVISVVTEGTDTLVSKSSFTSIAMQYGFAKITKRIAGTPNMYHMIGDLG